MRHLFIIQCHEFEPAMELRKLIERISPNFKTLFAFDLKSKDYDKFKSVPNSFGFATEYFGWGMAWFHFNLWSAIAEPENAVSDFDYYHLISQSDLPFMAILRVDEIVKGWDLYGWESVKKSGDKELHKAPAWYGLSRRTLKILGNTNDFEYRVRETLRNEVMNVVKPIYESDGLDYFAHPNFKGSPDEYTIGHVLHRLDDLELARIPSALRLIVFPDGWRTDFNDEPWSDYGMLSKSKTSPITLLWVPKVQALFKNSDILFGRKFEYKSDSYNKIMDYWDETLNRNSMSSK